MLDKLTEENKRIRMQARAIRLQKKYGYNPIAALHFAYVQINKEDDLLIKGELGQTVVNTEGILNTITNDEN